VPDPDSITVKGFLSEHDIPLDEPADPGLLYATAALAWNADLDVFTPLATVVVGFGTDYDEDTFLRPPLNIGLVIDVSGSMAELIDEPSGTSKLHAVKIAVDRMLAQLDATDRVSLVTFNTIGNLRVEYVPGTDIVSLKSALDELEPEGGTDLARGMRRAYAAVKEHHDDSRFDRLIVFTDALLTARPNRQTDELIAVMNEYAANGIGATIFGVGTDFGHEIAYDISHIRGGNYVFLSDYDRIVTVFDEEFDFLVTPVAYDVTLTVSVPFEFDVVGVHGIPFDDPLPHVLELEIPALFLSARQGGGAVLIRVRAGALVNFSRENTVADITLSYTTPAGEPVEHDPISAVMPAGFNAESTINYFENDGVKRAVLLLNTALTLRGACEDVHPYAQVDYWYRQPDYERAIERLSELLPYFDDLAEGLPDRASDSSRGLSQERALITRLLANLGG
jgi:Ca-activated chloride channel family protein